MKRRVLPALALLSLLMFAATCVVWARSYFVRDIVGFGRAGGDCHLAQSILGRVHLLSTLGGGCEGGVTRSSDRLVKHAMWNGGMSSYPQQIRWRLGCAVETYSIPHLTMGGGFPTTFATRHRLVVVPYAYPAVLFAVAPAACAIRRWRASRRARTGLCLTCGYDLRASPDRCPECGVAAAG